MMSCIWMVNIIAKTSVLPGSYQAACCIFWLLVAAQNSIRCVYIRLDLDLRILPLWCCFRTGLLMTVVLEVWQKYRSRFVFLLSLVAAQRAMGTMMHRFNLIPRPATAFLDLRRASRCFRWSAEAPSEEVITQSA